MSEAPGRRREAEEHGSQMDFAEGAREQANVFIDAHPDLLEKIAASENMQTVRAAVIDALGYDSDKSATLVSDASKAVLAEALGRWNKLRLEKGL